MFNKAPEKYESPQENPKKYFKDMFERIDQESKGTNRFIDVMEIPAALKAMPPQEAHEKAMELMKASEEIVKAIRSLKEKALEIKNGKKD